MFSILVATTFSLFQPTSLWLFDGAHNDVGSGTASDPYQIHSAEAFRDLSVYGCGPTTSDDCDAHYELGGTLDLGGVELSPIGSDDHPFTGTFDGQGYEIRHAAVIGDGYGYLGLFGVIEGARIRDLGVRYVDVMYAYKAGILVGKASSSRIDSLRVYSSDVSSSTYAGGVVAEAYDSYIHDNYLAGVVVSASGRSGGVASQVFNCQVYRTQLSGRVWGASAGGIVAAASDRSVIADNRSTATVTGRAAGGVASRTASNAHLGHNLVLGPVSGTDFEGGILANRYDYSGTFSANYFSTDRTGITSVNHFEGPIESLAPEPGVFAATDLRLRERSTYVDWEFRSSWAHSSGFFPRVRLY